MGVTTKYVSRYVVCGKMRIVSAHWKQPGRMQRRSTEQTAENSSEDRLRGQKLSEKELWRRRNGRGGLEVKVRLN